MPPLPDSEESLWRTFYKSVEYIPYSGDTESDVVIIGGGITGLTSAYLLKKAGLNVIVLEKDTVGSGTTGRTTGKVTSQHTLTYYDMQERLGVAAAKAYAEANEAAIKQVQKIITQEKIDCDWELDDNYVYTTDANNVEKIRQEAETAAGLDLPASFETTSPLPFEIKAAMKFTNQGKFNSQKYLLGLAQAIHGNDSHVFEHSAVVGIHGGSPARVWTRHGTVFAKNVIVATNVPTFPLIARGGYCLLEYPTQSYIVAGELPRSLKGMYISPDSDQYSILPITVEGQRMILIGGEGGHLPGLGGKTSKKYQRLADYATKHFKVKSITNQWGDRDYLAYDNLPLIGKLYPWSQHIFVGTGFRKWGLSNGTVAAMVLSDTLTGNNNPWAHVFDSTRLQPIKYIPRTTVNYLKQNIG